MRRATRAWRCSREKIGGRYMMVGRQDGQNMFLLESDDLAHWDGGELLMAPQISVGVHPDRQLRRADPD